MVVINFFRKLFSQIPALFNFVSTRLGDIVDVSGLPSSIANMTILDMFGIGIIITITAFLLIHLIKLFI